MKTLIELFKNGYFSSTIESFEESYKMPALFLEDCEKSILLRKAKVEEEIVDFPNGKQENFCEICELFHIHEFEVNYQKEIKEECIDKVEELLLDFLRKRS